MARPDRSPGRPDRVQRLFEHLLEDQSAETPTSPSVMGAYFELIVAEVMRPPAPTSVASAAVLAERARAIVDSRLTDRGLNTSSIANQLSCSADHLGRVFRATFGETLTAYIHHKRIDRARTLFRTTDHPVDSVAAACGFVDSRYFRRMFSRHVGMTPRELRCIYPVDGEGESVSL